ncbi:MAG TPA: DNA repair protein RadA [Mycobacteriales bacterium]|nr:DNA repair protein RadA [Mycobacteriales bacterium]
MAMKAARERPSYRCDECGSDLAQWVGRCPQCQAWGTVAEVATASPGLRVVAGPVSAPARPIATVPADAARHRPTGEPELDRVLGGGLVPGSVALLAGEPGVGKSTLLLSAAARIAASGRRCLVVTGEESASQVRLRAERIGALADDLYLAAETDLAALIGHVEAVNPDVLIVDSVQTLGSGLVDGSPGGVAQVREVAATVIRLAKSRAMATVLVGHVTKDGAVAGPRTLEHLVDVVLSFEGDRHSRLRLVRTVKNRYGPADEVGCFDLTEDGIVGLPDPSGLFLAHGNDPVEGTCVTVTMEGRRALVTEVQALVGGEQPATPRRATSGLDSARVAMLLAVLERHEGLKLSVREVYAATVGGVRIAEPASDLALATAIKGACSTLRTHPGMVAIGEVGLAGEIRPVTALRSRLAEAGRLGFTMAVVPPRSGATDGLGIRVVEARTLSEAMRACFAPP